MTKVHNISPSPSSPEPEKNWPAWIFCPPVIRHDPNIPSTAKLLFAEIHNLSYTLGYCSIRDKELGEKLGINRTRANALIMEMVNNGFITIKEHDKKNGIKHLIVNWDHPGIAPYKEMKGVQKIRHPYSENKTPVSEKLNTGVHKIEHGCSENHTYNVSTNEVTNEGKRMNSNSPFSFDQKNINARSVELLQWFNECLQRFQLNQFELTEKRIQVAAALLEKYQPGDLQRVIKHKCREWMGSPKMRPHCRPDTIFKLDKFSQYLYEANNQPVDEWTKRREADNELPVMFDPDYPY